MLETHRYVGVREAGELVSIAGVHVYSPRFGAAALGNVATDPAARGRGHGTVACSHLCQLLAADGISTISLNVRADNKAAIGVYERLGFSPVAEYLEASLG
jgi:ribosomal protein S18 acetylase RimI-like enzyme